MRTCSVDELMSRIKRGSRVTFLRYNGTALNPETRHYEPTYCEATGVAVMIGPGGWVLNCGGPHGTPQVVNASNLVAAAGYRAVKKPHRA
jgi:hypothetical protein